MKFLIVGCKGRLGNRIFEKAKDKHEVVGIDVGQDIFDLVNFDFDAIVDVSSPENSLKTLEFALFHKIPLVIGATGHTKTQIKKIDSAKTQIPIMLCPNFSIGIIVLNLALEMVLKVNFKDAYVTEYHHEAKKDIPSGTAKEIEKMISKTNTTLHKTVSIRQNKIVGKHKIDLFLKDECVTLSHIAESRDCFANGAIFALEHISKMKPGRYEMKDFLFENCEK